MSAPTPEDVARAIVNEHLSSAGAMEREIAAALRAARAAAIEEAATFLSIHDEPELALAIRALGEESAAPQGGGAPK